MKRVEDGFTLVELLIAVMVLGVVVSALGAALITALKNVDATQTRLSESHDAQMASAFVVTDVQSATAIVTTQPKCAATTSVAVLSWSDQGVANVATYIVETADGDRRLRRRHVAGGASRDVVIAHHLASTCVDPTADDPAVVVSRPDVNRVVLALTDTTGYRFSLTGERRARS